MKTKTLLAITSIGALLTFSAQASLFEMYDNFDSYANQAALTAVWNVGASGAGLNLAQSGPTPVSSPNDVSQTTTAASRLARPLSTPVQSTLLDWSFQLYDGGGSRDFACLYGYTGAWGTGLQTVMAIGDYNTGNGSSYMGRYSAITGAVYGDGAVATTGDGGTGGWFSLTSAANRSTGAWHQMRVLGMVDPNNASMLELQFYVDGTLGGSIRNVSPYNLTFATIGGAVSTATAGAAFDNYDVIMVPEPSAVVLSLLGGLGMMGWMSRRRTA